MKRVRLFPTLLVALLSSKSDLFSLMFVPGRFFYNVVIFRMSPVLVLPFLFWFCSSFHLLHVIILHKAQELLYVNLSTTKKNNDFNLHTTEEQLTDIEFKRWNERKKNPNENS